MLYRVENLEFPWPEDQKKSDNLDMPGKRVVAVLDSYRKADDTVRVTALVESV